jgi:DNA-binding transcriptional MerR regulator
VQTLISIGDFSRATHLSAKALRLYHQEGLLEPAAVDPSSGYRRYDLTQIPVAQVIRRLRALDVPLEDIRAIVGTTDLAERNELLARHLHRLEEELGRTQDAIASVRGLIEPPAHETRISYRTVPAMRVAAIRQEVTSAELGPWYNGALGELYATLSTQGTALAGEAGGVYADELFSQEQGQATIYLPVSNGFRGTGRVRELELPPVELAVIAHSGPHDEIDRAYGTLADHVTRREIAVNGPIREFYPVNLHHTGDSARWRTEIGWPVFATRPRLAI